MQLVAVGILLKDGHVLACQRKSSSRYPLKWEFPGGKIEEHESPWQALVRELREELAIEASKGQEFHRQEWIYHDGSGDARKDGTYRVHYFLVGSFTGVPRNLAFEQIHWVRPSDLMTMDILEGNKDAVNLLVNHVASESNPI